MLHNFVEYNTLSSYIIEICNINNIPYFIFSEHCNDFFYNGEYITSKKFKNCVKEIEYMTREIVIFPEYRPVISKEKESKEKESINKFFKTYESIQDSKKTNRIIYIN